MTVPPGAPQASRLRLDGVSVVVTAGGTREPIDPVRFIGNRSSGKMGNALAAACLEAGAIVELVTAAAPPAPAPGLRVTEVETAEEMREAVWAALRSADLLFMAAAVADYRPRQAAERKVKKDPAGISLDLVPTTDILASLRHHPRRSAVFLVGFAAETDDLVANARDKLHRKGLDLIVLNDVRAPGIGMGADDNAVTVLDAEGVVAAVPRRPKLEVARAIVVAAAARLPLASA
ncbi:MAG: phosphopantothenoylcysteine decarboxylase [Candidatus Dormibacteria bacterium]|jgi:phosphopantothenoylcysteine decarboxylase/phosphopantothenate--cysteine ligase